MDYNIFVKIDNFDNMTVIFETLIDYFAAIRRV